MPNQLDVFVLVMGFLRMLMNLHEKDVAQTTAGMQKLTFTGLSR